MASNKPFINPRVGLLAKMVNERVMTPGEKYLHRATSELQGTISPMKEVQNQHISAMEVSLGEARLLTIISSLLASQHPDRPMKVLDVGRFTGLSAGAMAKGMKHGGEVITCDLPAKSAEEAKHARIAKNFWKKEKVGGSVREVLGPGIDTMKKLIAEGQSNTFDMIFIDADKMGYPGYYAMAMKLLRPGGVVLLDNMLWSGKVADRRDPEANTRAIRNLDLEIAYNKKMLSVLLDSDDGVFMSMKLHHRHIPKIDDREENAQSYASLPYVPEEETQTARQMFINPDVAKFTEMMNSGNATFAEEQLIAEVATFRAKLAFSGNKADTEHMKVSMSKARLLTVLTALVAGQHPTTLAKALTIGTGNGSCAGALAKGMFHGGSVTVCDMPTKTPEEKVLGAIASRYWKREKISRMVHQHVAPASELMDKLLADGQKEKFDIIYIDGDKKEYDALYEKALKLVRPGGLVLLNDMLERGRLRNTKKIDPAVRATHKLNFRIASDPRVRMTLQDGKDSPCIVEKLDQRDRYMSAPVTAHSKF